MNRYGENSIRYTVGGNFSATTLYDDLTTPKVMKFISDSITFRLKDVHTTSNKPLVVSNKKIERMISDVIDTYTPKVGGIFSREIQRYQTHHEEFQARQSEIVDIVINSLTNSIKNEYDTIEKNKKFSKMNTVYGDFNEAGLQAYSSSMIKLNNKNDNKTALFHMRY